MHCVIWMQIHFIGLFAFWENPISMNDIVAGLGKHQLKIPTLERNRAHDKIGGSKMHLSEGNWNATLIKAN